MKMPKIKENLYNQLCNSLEKGETVDIITTDSNRSYLNELSERYKDKLFIAVNKNHYIYQLVI